MRRRRLFKFGVPLPSGKTKPHRYEGVYEVAAIKGEPRLVVAPIRDQVRILRLLCDALPEPLGILYVLVVPRTDRYEPGRYQSPLPVPRSEVNGFLERFTDFLERDGRHHLWVGSLESDWQVVYDRHDVIYAYGPLGEFEEVLEREGLSRGRVEIPGPAHAHRYHSEFDGDFERVMEHWPWTRFELDPVVDV